MKKIKYKKGYKYQLAETHYTHVDIYPKEIIETNYIGLNMHGMLTIRAGYAWDGPSGPTVDTKNFMRGSLIHDALYELIRMDKLKFTDRKQADMEIRKACLEDGMSWLRAWYVYRTLRRVAGFAADPANKKKIITAP